MKGRDECDGVTDIRTAERFARCPTNPDTYPRRKPHTDPLEQLLPQLSTPRHVRNVTHPAVGGSVGIRPPHSPRIHHGFVTENKRAAPLSSRPYPGGHGRYARWRIPLLSVRAAGFP